MPDTMDEMERLMAMRDLDEIFALEDDTQFCIALSSALDEKTGYGDKLEELAPEARVFYLCNALEEKVNSDGLYGFFLESYGQWALETVDALETVGALKTADILRRAIALFPDGICPKDGVERENILLDDRDRFAEACGGLDGEFYAYPDGSLQAFYAAYARDHRDAFS